MKKALFLFLIGLAVLACNNNTDPDDRPDPECDEVTDEKVQAFIRDSCRYCRGVPAPGCDSAKVIEFMVENKCDTCLTD